MDRDEFFNQEFSEVFTFNAEEVQLLGKLFERLEVVGDSYNHMIDYNINHYLPEFHFRQVDLFLVAVIGTMYNMLALMKIEQDKQNIPPPNAYLERMNEYSGTVAELFHTALRDKQIEGITNVFLDDPKKMRTLFSVFLRLWIKNERGEMEDHKKWSSIVGQFEKQFSQKKKAKRKRQPRKKPDDPK